MQNSRSTTYRKNQSGDDDDGPHRGFHETNNLPVCHLRGKGDDKSHDRASSRIPAQNSS